MKRTAVILMEVIWATVTLGCTQSPEKARHTIDEYLADDAMRQKQVALCVNDPGSIGKTPDCINATRAEARARRGSFSTRFRPSFDVSPSTKPKEKGPTTQNFP